MYPFAYYFIADYHGLVKVQDPARLNRHVEEAVAIWLAPGLNSQEVVFCRRHSVKFLNADQLWERGKMKPNKTKPDRTVDETEAPPKTCAMHPRDQQGHANLCCCYIMDADGSLHDPCYQPVDACCP
jgi:hypothetical protein